MSITENRLYSLLSVLSLGLLLFTLVSCGTLSQQPVSHSVKLPDNHRMHFSGKGAGAGMMLSSSMGPMGIAIGVAIDEGIAKEIGEAARLANVDLAQIVTKAFSGSNINQSLNIVVEHYGFVTTTSVEGIKDPVVPKLVMKVSSENISEVVLDIYAGANENVCSKQTYELSAVKQSGAAVEKAFSDAAECGVKVYLNAVTIL